mmetsp:Transcript_61399/g.171653  ORF Transcript_61399/g.171653 Transcript_61399/m.171653 type:complete len:294 (-) Transcript_61399:635-1516(-)
MRQRYDYINAACSKAGERGQKKAGLLGAFKTRSRCSVRGGSFDLDPSAAGRRCFGQPDGHEFEKKRSQLCHGIQTKGAVSPRAEKWVGLGLGGGTSVVGEGNAEVDQRLDCPRERLGRDASRTHLVQLLPDRGKGFQGLDDHLHDRLRDGNGALATHDAAAFGLELPNARDAASRVGGEKTRRARRVAPMPMFVFELSALVAHRRQRACRRPFAARRSISLARHHSVEALASGVARGDERRGRPREAELLTVPNEVIGADLRPRPLPARGKPPTDGGLDDMLPVLHHRVAQSH